MNKKQNPSEVLNTRTTIRYTTEEYSLLKKRAENAGVSFSEYCRQATLNAFVKAKPITVELQKVEALRNLLDQYHTNFNRISNLIEKRTTIIVEVVKQVAFDISLTIKQIKI